MSCRTVVGASFQNWMWSRVYLWMWFQWSDHKTLCPPVFIADHLKSQKHILTAGGNRPCVFVWVPVCVCLCMCVCSCLQTSEAALCILSSLRRSDFSCPPFCVFVCVLSHLPSPSGSHSFLSLPFHPLLFSPIIPVSVSYDSGSEKTQARSHDSFTTTETHQHNLESCH